MNERDDTRAAWDAIAPGYDGGTSLLRRSAQPQTAWRVPAKEAGSKCSRRQGR
jgi:hypothetical protein